MKKKKKIIIFMLLVILVITVIALVVNKDRNYVAVPNIDSSELIEDDGIVKFENNINGISIKDRNIKKRDGNFYIVIQIENTSEEDKYDLPIGIDFMNIDGNSIYHTGTIQSVLFQGMIDEAYVPITSDIAEMLTKHQIDHIVIKELQ